MNKAYRRFQKKKKKRHVEKLEPCESIGFAIRNFQGIFVTQQKYIFSGTKVGWKLTLMAS